MAKLPEWRREGWRPNGPGLCNCPHCGARVTTNALGRNSHLQACSALKRQEQAREAQRASTTIVRDINGDPMQVGDKVRRARRGSDVIPVERRSLYGALIAIGEGEQFAGYVRVSGFIAWESPTNFEKVTP
jgi:hypothetical protein